MIDLAIVAFCLAAAVGLGLRAARLRRPGLADYVLAGRTLTLPSFVATLVPTFYGGVLGVGEFTWRNGLSNWFVMGLPYYLFAAVYALFLAERVRLEPGLTVPDHIERAYGRSAAVLAAGLVFLLACPADELLMAGALFGDLAGLRLPWAMLLAAALSVGLLLAGGLRSDVESNRLELVLMFGGFMLVLPFAAARLGGPSWAAARLPSGHLSLSGGLTPLKIVSWWLIAVWTLVDPSFHQRCAAAADPGVARRGILVSIAFWAAFDLMTTSAGLYARAALPSLGEPLLAFPRLADLVLPPVARGLFFAGLAASMLAALQGRALLAALALGKDGAGRWLEADEERREAWSRWALVLGAAFALALGLALPSVVGLWYAVGSAVIPGLLLPLMGVYRPSWRVGPPWAFAASLGGWSASTAWLAWSAAAGRAPLSIEPMFPGLAVSGLLWGAGRWSGRRA